MKNAPFSVDKIPVRSERLPGLDGLRALSICLVLLGHGRSMLPEHTLDGFWVECISNHRLGVSVFFVISGFIITWILLQERERTGRIRLGLFYQRRLFRIFPAFYFFLFCLAGLSAAGYLEVPAREWLAVVLFYWNYLPEATTWWVGHFWSLAVEEQFYLIWPTCLVVASLTRVRNWVLGVIVFSPAVRLLTYAFEPSLRDRIAWLTHTQIDLMAFGCLAALLARPVHSLPTWRKIPGYGAFAAALFAFAASPFLTDWGRSAYGLTLRNTLEGLSLALLMVWLIQNPRGSWGRIFNHSAVAYIGRVSFSLYLWQQLFLTPQNPLGIGFWAALAATFAMAVLSYHAVEQPFLRLGARLTGGEAVTLAKPSRGSAL